MKKILLLISLALTAQNIKAQADAFITSWVTDTGFETLTLPVQPDAPNYNINWGDGSATNTYNATQIPSHFYIGFGEHTISFTGTFPKLNFVGQTKLKAVQQWGTQKWTSMANMFESCTTLISFPNQAPDLSLCSDMSRMFYRTFAFNQPIGSWNVSNVTNMSYMFFSSAFNQPIDNWDVSNVTNMGSMFNGTTSFNQPIGSWNVSNVTNMTRMFYIASSFNQPISNWNVSKVTDMTGMFSGTKAFNQAIGSWDVSNVTNMSRMFSGTGLSTANYDATLIGWATRGANGGVLKQGGYFDGGTSNYCNGLGARNYLINTYGWIITDGGLDFASLGTEDFDKSSVSLYPNPVLNVLNIDNNLTDQPYKIVDALGKVILKGKLNEGDNSINVEQLSKGIYYLKVSDNKASKFIKE